jgi:transcriptional regulator with XRE-family HTH domain
MKETAFKRLRIKLGLTQKQCGDLLGYAPNTAIRYETARNPTPDWVMVLLPMLAAGEIPKPCKATAAIKWSDTQFLAGHIGRCPDCILALIYLRQKSK